MQHQWQCRCSKKMLHRKRSTALKPLVCAAYFPWCSAHNSRSIEPACVPLSINPWTAPRKTLLLPWSEYAIISSECSLVEDETDSKGKNPIETIYTGTDLHIFKLTIFLCNGTYTALCNEVHKTSGLVIRIPPQTHALLQKPSSIQMNRITWIWIYTVQAGTVYYQHLQSDLSEVEKSRLFMSCW